MDLGPKRTTDFASPWRDLRERLTNAAIKLQECRRASADPRDKTRLAWKRDAVEAALDAWEKLNDKIAARTIDHATAWRTFTTQVESLSHVTGVNPGYHEGVSLALSYQRGYAPHVDAPATTNQHRIQ